MADAQKTIEILLQFKQAGEEIVQASQEALEKLQFITMSLGGDVNDALSMPGAEEAQSKIDAVTGAVGGLNSSLEGTAVESKASQAALQALAESAASGLNTATASAEALTAALQQTQQAAGTSGASSIQSLNSALGRSSELGGTLRLLAGSGPILALGLLASKFAEVSKEADRLSIELRKGEIGWAEFVEGILLKIPVVGQISQGIIDIQDAITGVGYRINEYSSGQDIVFTFNYRVMNGNGSEADGVDAGTPIGDKPPHDGHFLIRIWSGAEGTSTVLRGIVVDDDTGTATYTNAQLIADFGSEPASFVADLGNVLGAYTSFLRIITITKV